MEVLALLVLSDLTRSSFMCELLFIFNFLIGLHIVHQCVLILQVKLTLYLILLNLLCITKCQISALMIYLQA